jgi:hypothetical protein
MSGKQTTLDLNGPILSFIQQPQSVTVNHNTTATLVGIATAAFPTQIPANPATNTGTLLYQWYAEGFGALTDGPFRGAILSGTSSTTLVVSNVKSPDTNLTNFFLTVDYVPSAYSQPPGSEVNTGTTRSTGNAINEILSSNTVTLTVRPFITIIEQPQDVTVTANSSAVFSVNATLSDSRFGSLSYQWQFNQQNLSDGSLVRGSRGERLTLTTSPPLVEPIISAPVCISVIDESSPTASTIRTDWLSFRANHPNRIFWLLQPGRTKTDLKIPAEYEADSRANYSQVARDGGSTSLRSDWFVISNLGSYPAGTVVSLAIDTSGSMTLSTVRASYDLFKQKCAQAGIIIVETTIPDERWAPPHNKALPNTTSSTTCISVIDESSPTASTIRTDWLSFRANHPNRIFWLLQPGGTSSGSLKIPSEYVSDPRANGPVAVARDGGSTNSRSDWFVICNLGSLKPGSVVSLAIDVSGSMTLSTVRASYDLFKQKCAQAGLVLVEVNISDERWAPPHNKALPEPESTTVGISTVRTIVSNPSAQSVTSNNADLNVLSTFSRKLVNFEYILPSSESTAQLASTNLFNGEYTLTQQRNQGLISFYAPEIDIDIEMDLFAKSGLNQGSYMGGRGGFSRVRFTLRRNVEYVIGNFNENGVIVIYRQSKVLLACGTGGDAGTIGNGGDGGGVTDAGAAGVGRNAGAGGSLISSGTLDQNAIFGSAYTGSETPKAIRPLGGKIIGCPPGDYWRTQGFSPCQSLGNSQFRLANGTIITNTASISRGYKSGISYRQVIGLGDSGANGGFGATGGSGGQSGSGGGGGSGYQDGTIQVIQSILGGNTTSTARIIMRLAS